MMEPIYKIAQALHARRAAVGLKKYGQHLTAASPGCMIVHAIEEAADLTEYLLAEVQRRKIVMETLNELSKEMNAELAIGWAYNIEKLYDLLGGKSAIEQYDKILGGGTVVENATVAPDPRDERDQLRAELAAAKNLLARIHRDGGHHTEAVGFAQSVADAGDKVSEWLLAAEERTALAAHVERLRQAMEEALPSLCYSGWPDGIKAALAATPAQSLAAHDAAVKVAVLREVANREFNPEQSAEERWAHGVLYGNADRIEKEAPHA